MEFEPLRGEFRARVLSCTPDKGKKPPHNPLLVWEFVLLDKPHEGWKRKTWTVTVGKGSGKAKSLIKAVGGSVEGERIKFRPSSAVSKDVILVMRPQKDDEGVESQEFDEVAKVKPAAPASL